MSRKKRDRPSPAPSRRSDALPKGPDYESADLRRGDAVTVAWMLSAVFALAGEVLALVGMIANSLGVQLGDARVVHLVSQLALLVAVVAAVLCLVLLPLVHRFRRDPPPEAVTYGTVAISLAPLVTMLAQWLAR